MNCIKICFVFDNMFYLQFFIFLMVSEFGPLPCSVVTTTRKFFTVLGSVILFGNTLLPRQWFGTVFVFLGKNTDLYLLTLVLVCKTFRPAFQSRLFFSEIPIYFAFHFLVLYSFFSFIDLLIYLIHMVTIWYTSYTWHNLLFFLLDQYL